MPLKLVDPRPGKTPNYYIRGAYLGQHVDESAGTSVKAVAQRFLVARREAIERGEYQSRAALKQEPTFLSAAISYIANGGDRHAYRVYMASVASSEGTQSAEILKQAFIQSREKK